MHSSAKLSSRRKSLRVSVADASAMVGMFAMHKAALTVAVVLKVEVYFVHHGLACCCVHDRHGCPRPSACFNHGRFRLEHRLRVQPHKSLGK